MKTPIISIAGAGIAVSFVAYVVALAYGSDEVAFWALSLGLLFGAFELIDSK